MKKLFKKITATCVAVIMMTAVLCTYASAVGVISRSVSGNFGNFTLQYSYSVDDEGARTNITTSGYKSYSVKFSSVKGTAANISFRNTTTRDIEAVITVPRAMSGGMPDSFTTIINLKPDTEYEIKFSSSSKSVIANGYAILYHIKSYN